MAVRKTKSKRKYSKSASKDVEKEMKAYKRGTAKSGRGGAKVKSRKQAIAIGLSKARKKGKKVPKKAIGARSASSLFGKAKKIKTRKSTAPRKSTARKTTARKTTTKRAVRKSTARKYAAKRRTTHKRSSKARRGYLASWFS